MSFVEKEIKILSVNYKKVIKKLKKMGAKKIFHGNIVDIYYDTAKMSLACGKKRVRIRKKGKEYMITMKKRKNTKDIKLCYEKEMFVSGYQQAKNILSNYGLLPQWTKKKKRISYRYKDIYFDIDFYKNIPPVLEIEAQKKKDIFLRIKKLGLKKKTTASFGARGLFKFYGISIRK